MDSKMDVTGTYERPTLNSLGSFRAETGRFFIGFFADGQGAGWQWSGLNS